MGHFPISASSTMCGPLPGMVFLAAEPGRKHGILRSWRGKHSLHRQQGKGGPQEAVPRGRGNRCVCAHGCKGRKDTAA